MGEKLANARSNWKKIRKTSAFHNSLVFLLFVAMATVFWFVMALNDSVQDSFQMRFRIVNVPDSATFITNPPDEIHVGVRDKGTNLLRTALLREPTVEINFRDCARDGVFRLSHSDLLAALKQTLGASAQVLSLSVDSLRLEYTFAPGVRVPIKVVADVEAQAGKVVAGAPTVSVAAAILYSAHVSLDTISCVETEPIVRRNLEETTHETVAIRPIRGVKIVPQKVDVTIPVEPLVSKTQLVPVSVINIPAGQSVLLFPNSVEIAYYVPMSRFNDDISGFSVVADYNRLADDNTGRVPLTLHAWPHEAVNPHLKTESVEYTIVK